jgi:Predicted acetyltransferase
VEIHQEPERSRYVLCEDGEVIGEERYLDLGGGERVLFHTVVAPERSGQGLASELVQRVVEDTIAAGLRVVPVCPYVAAWLPRHPEYAANVVEPRPEHLAAARHEMGA